MTIGTVKFFNTNKGFGFISPEGGGKDVFVHATAVEQAGLRTLQEGQKVSFDVVPDARGAKAANARKAARTIRYMDIVSPLACEDAENFGTEKSVSTIHAASVSCKTMWGVLTVWSENRELTAES